MRFSQLDYNKAYKDGFDKLLFILFNFNKDNGILYLN